MFYTPAANELRAFFRDKLRFPFTDTGEGWLIFDAPAVEIGCHPAERKFHGLSFYCDTLRQTMTELQRRGVEFTDIVEQEWGQVTRFRVPGGDEIELYQPKYAKRPLRARTTGRSGRRKRAKTGTR